MSRVGGARALGILFFCACVLPSPTKAAPPVEDGHSVALTVSPVHLVLPIVELTGEFRVHERIGIAGVLGAGMIGPHLTDLENFVLEVGASFRGYIIGGFDHGMQLGVEAMYAFISARDARVTGVGNGLGLSPFAGYKISAANGFTFDTQAGPSFVFASAFASDDQGNSASAQRGVLVGFMINLNLGYAF